MGQIYGPMLQLRDYNGLAQAFLMCNTCFAMIPQVYIGHHSEWHEKTPMINDPIEVVKVLSKENDNDHDQQDKPK